MFYEPEDGHGLRHNPFNALIAPRPIAWISSVSAEGEANLAPYSFFNGVAYQPPQIMFASTFGKADQEAGKDTVTNIRQTGVFAVNLVAYAQRDAMNITSQSFEKGVDEFEKAGLTKEPCKVIDCPRIADVPATLECTLVQITKLPGEANFTVFGEVVGVHIRDDTMVDGKVDITRFEMLARLGYRDYSSVTETFTLARPDD